MVMQTIPRERFTVRLLTVIVAAWLVLTVWSVSPYAPYLNHEILDHLPVTLSVEYLTLLLVFVAGWMLMVVAMMLPSSLPLITRFRREVERTRPTVLLMAGYVGVWTVVGGLAHVGDVFVHAASHRFAWLGTNEWVLSATLLAVAGVYQFTPLKRVCLRSCRSIGEHRGSRHALRALRAGLRHGLRCVGCCGPLMLLMFGVACGNVLVMLGLAAVMVAEKHVSRGWRISVPLGVVLLGVSLAVSLIGAGTM